MRFPSSYWEREWFAFKSGFYTNRIKISEMISICTNIGFKVTVRDVMHWPTLPINKNRLANEFQNISNSDLLTQEAHLVMGIK